MRNNKKEIRVMNFEFRRYQRHFCQPLQTHHGIWKIREGIILRLEDNRGIGWGEIAPLPWFGSETLEQALSFCQKLGNKITQSDIFSIPEILPACQFGFESALTDLLSTHSFLETHNITYSYLLPTGEIVLQKWQNIWQQAREKQLLGTITFKWKIGVHPLKEELDIFEKLLLVLPTESQLRLDANGGLTTEETKTWLSVTDNLSIIEFIEQPLPPAELTTMLNLSTYYSTPLALDESVATLKQLMKCYQAGWKGIFVIKPAIIGSPRLLRQFVQNNVIDLVFSSVFETHIARQAALALAVKLGKNKRAVGFGTKHWFKEVESNWIETLWKTF